MPEIFIVAWAALIAAVMVIGWLTAHLAAGETLRRDYFIAGQARRRRRHDQPLTQTTGPLRNLVQFPSSDGPDRRIKRGWKSAG
ncbi:MAG TPA: hypothetical protein VGR24_06330 [bacterium]|jgi:hypothetical protein|nr:hypothetical protein [bacterium]